METYRCPKCFHQVLPGCWLLLLVSCSNFFGPYLLRLISNWLEILWRSSSRLYASCKKIINLWSVQIAISKCWPAMGTFCTKSFSGVLSVLFLPQMTSDWSETLLRPECPQRNSIYSLLPKYTPPHSQLLNMWWNSTLMKHKALISLMMKLNFHTASFLLKPT